MLNVLALTAVCLLTPVDGPLIAGYSPAGKYAGHWGVDFARERGGPVRAPIGGVVTFAGSVAGMRTVTIQPSIGVKVSVSYLDVVEVMSGAYVGMGQRIGRSGMAHGTSGVHLSLRFNGRYADPADLLCEPKDIGHALRLLRPPRPYPRRRANRNSRRDLRSDPHRSPSCRRSGPPPGATGSSPLHASRSPLAEIRPACVGRGAPTRHDAACHR